MSGVYARLGVKRRINAAGTLTRLGGSLMAEPVLDAMREAARSSVDIGELQVAAGAAIARATGAETGRVTSGAAAGLTLAAAACIAGLDVAKMARLPDTRGLANEILIPRTHRNAYDHALRAAGGVLVDLGHNDRGTGAGIRGLEPWEIDAAVTPASVAFAFTANADTVADLPRIVVACRRHGLKVIVDAAAQLPPATNLRAFVEAGADLVVFSGGKAIGGPQASGILAGRRDLIMAAALQHLDLDIYWDMWEPPYPLIDKSRLKGAPQHGIGRSCKAGKEEIVGLLTALRLFVAEGDAARHARWLKDCETVAAALQGYLVTITGGNDTGSVPTVEIMLDQQASAARDLCLRLEQGDPAIVLDPAQRDKGVAVVNPMCLKPGEAEIVGREIGRALAKI